MTNIVQYDYFVFNNQFEMINFFGLLVIFFTVQEKQLFMILWHFISDYLFGKLKLKMHKFCVVLQNTDFKVREMFLW